jgi:hypothetical protein
MIKSRRGLLKAMAGAAGVFAAVPVVSAAFQHPQPMPSANAPTNPNFPGGLNGPQASKSAAQPISPVNQAQITAMAQQLFQLASDLKNEVEHTNLAVVMPTTVIKRAQDIEKLAKQIRDRARG